MSTEKRRIRETVGLIVQLSLQTKWGDGEDDLRSTTIADALEDLFKDSQLGVVDGTDTGGGKLNVFIFDIADSNWDDVLNIVIKSLNEQGVLDGAVIARSISWETDEDEWVEHEVVWPENYKNRFVI